MWLDYSLRHGLRLVYTTQCTGREVTMAYPLYKNRSYYTLQMDELIDKQTDANGGRRPANPRKQDLNIVLHRVHDGGHYLRMQTFCFDELVELYGWMDHTFNEDGFLL